MIRNILKWVAICLGIIVGIFVLLVILMTIFPNFALFGHRYIGAHSTESNKQLHQIAEDIPYDIFVNTQNFDIQITESQTNNIELHYVDGKWGFANIKSTQLLINEYNAIFEIQMTEPQGLIWGSGTLYISLPANNYNGYRYNINIQTQHGDVNINHRFIDGLSISMEDGRFEWTAEQEIVVEETTKENEEGTESQEQVQTSNDSGNESANSNNATQQKTKIEPVKTITLQHFTFFGKQAKIDLNHFDNIYVGEYITSGILADNYTRNSFIVNNNSLDLDLKLLSGCIMINCDTISLNIETLFDYNEMKLITNSGRINISNLNGMPDSEYNIDSNSATIINTSAQVQISNVYSNTAISTRSGNIGLETTNKTIWISSNTGDVTIKEALGNIDITTKTGDIYITSYFSGANINTSSGDIYAYNKGEENFVNRTYILQDVGKIIAFSDNNTLNITSTNGSEIKATFRKMCANNKINHTITNKKGTSNIYVLVADIPFKVRAVGTVSGELGRNVYISSSSEYIYYNPSNQIPDEMASLNVEGGIVYFTGIYE